jgi:hypothetical protein
MSHTRYLDEIKIDAEFETHVFFLGILGTLLRNPE